MSEMCSFAVLTIILPLLQKKITLKVIMRFVLLWFESREIRFGQSGYELQQHLVIWFRIRICD